MRCALCVVCSISRTGHYPSGLVNKRVAITVTVIFAIGVVFFGVGLMVYSYYYTFVAPPARPDFVVVTQSETEGQEGLEGGGGGGSGAGGGAEDGARSGDETKSEVKRSGGGDPLKSTTVAGGGGSGYTSVNVGGDDEVEIVLGPTRIAEDDDDDMGIEIGDINMKKPLTAGHPSSSST